MTRLMGFLGACLPLDRVVSTIHLPVILNNYYAAPEPPPELVCSNLLVNGGFESGDFAPGGASFAQSAAGDSDESL